MEEDKLIGHELVIRRTGLFRKELSLKDIYYNDLIQEFNVDDNEHSYDNISLGLRIRQIIYDNISLGLRIRQMENMISHYSFRYGGDVIGKSHLEKRIKSLQARFVDLYITRAQEILEQTRSVAINR